MTGLSVHNRLSNYLNIFVSKMGFKSEIKWRAACSMIAYHILGIYWCIHYAFPVKWQTIVFAICMFLYSGMGITCGVHRLWSHRSYKATVPLNLFLITCFAALGQNSIYDWVRDHRLHHKYSDTDADPHNASRGFVFSHIGWLMTKKNEQVLKKGKQINMSDIENDPYLMFERKYSTELSIIFCYFLPTITGILLWGETWQCAIAWQWFIRYLAVFHMEMSINSVAHKFGTRPFNRNIKPTNNLFMTVTTLGEGSHNYHHVFPNDYKHAETMDIFNWSTAIINVWSKLGLVYDLKEPSPETIRSKFERLNSKDTDEF